VGLTFRYSPAMRYMRELVAGGFIGTPFIFNGYEQNSQWLDPKTPLRQVDHTADQSVIQVSSLEGYGAPIIDLAHLMVGRRPHRGRRDAAQLHSRADGARHQPHDAHEHRRRDIFLGEFANGALCSIQTSFVTVGNYPGIEARVYGSEGALICRLVEEAGVCETLRAARPDQVEFRDVDIPDRCYPPGGSRTESWRTLFYANLVSSFISEILSDDSIERR